MFDSKFENIVKFLASIRIFSFFDLETNTYLLTIDKGLSLNVWQNCFNVAVSMPLEQTLFSSCI